MPKINISDDWTSTKTRINIADEWRTALKVYISIHHNVTWESVQYMTWNDLIAETWDYQLQMWREVT